MKTITIAKATQSDAEALKALVLDFIGVSALIGSGEVARRFGWPQRVATDILRQLEAEGRAEHVNTAWRRT